MKISNSLKYDILHLKIKTINITESKQIEKLDWREIIAVFIKKF